MVVVVVLVVVVVVVVVVAVAVAVAVVVVVVVVVVVFNVFDYLGEVFYITCCLTTISAGWRSLVCP